MVASLPNQIRPHDTIYARPAASQRQPHCCYVTDWATAVTWTRLITACQVFSSRRNGALACSQHAGVVNLCVCQPACQALGSSTATSWVQRVQHTEYVLCRVEETERSILGHWMTMHPTIPTLIWATALRMLLHTTYIVLYVLARHCNALLLRCCYARFRRPGWNLGSLATSSTPPGRPSLSQLVPALPSSANDTHTLACATSAEFSSQWWLDWGWAGKDEQGQRGNDVAFCEGETRPEGTIRRSHLSRWGVPSSTTAKSVPSLRQLALFCVVFLLLLVKRERFISCPPLPPPRPISRLYSITKLELPRPT